MASLCWSLARYGLRTLIVHGSRTFTFGRIFGEGTLEEIEANHEERRIYLEEQWNGGEPRWKRAT